MQTRLCLIEFTYFQNQQMNLVLLGKDSADGPLILIWYTNEGVCIMVATFILILGRSTSSLFEVKP